MPSAVAVCECCRKPVRRWWEKKVCTGFWVREFPGGIAGLSHVPGVSVRRGEENIFSGNGLIEVQRRHPLSSTRIAMSAATLSR